MRTDKGGSKQSTHSTSISSWIERMQTMPQHYDTFASSILAEEAAKIGRLRWLANEIGLPIYNTHQFKLPHEMDIYHAECAKITSTSMWGLALRFSRQPPNNKAFFRQLGANLEAALFAARDYENSGVFLAAVTPYRTPERSGTLWVQDDQITLELVLGPHTWISKSAPTQDKLLSCTYAFPHLSVRHSTDNPTLRRILAVTLEQVTLIVLGYRLREVAEIRNGAYAEFHWHEPFGYRFIECSFSRTWTGAQLSRRDSERGSTTFL